MSPTHTFIVRRYVRILKCFLDNCMNSPIYFHLPTQINDNIDYMANNPLSMF